MLSLLFNKVLGPLALIGTVGAIAFCLLWLNARDAVIEERGACNVEVIQSALDAEVIAHTATRTNYMKQIEENIEQEKRETAAIEAAKKQEQEQLLKVAGLHSAIDKLMQEANFDEIPDSGECLNVYVLNDSVAGMRLRPESCNALGPGGWSAGSANCFSAEGINGTDSAGRDFATVTYADTLKLWGIDRANLMVCNGRLEQIETLGGP